MKKKTIFKFKHNKYLFTKYLQNDKFINKENQFVNIAIMAISLDIKITILNNESNSKLKSLLLKYLSLSLQRSIYPTSKSLFLKNK